jgi:hypothetical protein
MRYDVRTDLLSLSLSLSLFLLSQTASHHRFTRSQYIPSPSATALLLNGSSATLQALPQLSSPPIEVRSACNAARSTDASASTLPAAAVPYVCVQPTVDPLTHVDAWGRVGSPSTPTLLDSSCAMQCPPPFYTTAQYATARHTYNTLVILSFICELWLTATFLAFSEMRSKRNVLYFLICTLGIAIALMVSVGEPDKVVSAVPGRAAPGQRRGIGGRACLCAGFVVLWVLCFVLICFLSFCVCFVCLSHSPNFCVLCCAVLCCAVLCCAVVRVVDIASDVFERRRRGDSEQVRRVRVSRRVSALLVAGGRVLVVFAECACADRHSAAREPECVGAQSAGVCVPWIGVVRRSHSVRPSVRFGLGWAVCLLLLLFLPSLMHLTILFFFFFFFFF